MYLNDLFAQNNPKLNINSYQKKITITDDGKERTMTIITEKDGKKETKILKGYEVDKYLQDMARENMPLIKPTKPRFPKYSFNFDPDEWMKKIQEEFNFFPPSIKGFSFKDDGNEFFFGFKSDSLFDEYFNFNKWFEDFNLDNDTDFSENIYKPEEDKYNNENQKQIDNQKENLKTITKYIRFEEYSDNSVNPSKIGISGLQLIPYQEEGFFRLEFYNKTKKDVAIEVKQADGRYVFGQNFPGPGNISCVINISPETPGIWYIKISKGKKNIYRRLIIS